MNLAVFGHGESAFTQRVEFLRSRGRSSEAEHQLPKLKFLAVRRSVERDPRPFVWIDDDLDFFHDEAVAPREWAAGLSTPSLLIAPDSDTGLVPHQLDAVEEFVRQHGRMSPEPRR